MSALGQKRWAIPGGHVPLGCTGREPEFTSFDQLCVLNTGGRDARVTLTIYYSDRDPAGPYPLAVASRRVRHVRVNDLIDPAAVPLDTDFAIVVESNVPIVVQFTRQDTRQAANAIATTMGYAG